MSKSQIMLQTVSISVIIGGMVFFVVYFIGRFTTYAYVHGTETEYITKIVCLCLGGALGLSAFMWSMVVQVGMNAKKEMKKHMELERERRREMMKRSPYAASLFDVIDDEGNKEFFTIYGRKVKPGEDLGPVYIGLRMAALICTFFTIGAGLILVCMLMSVTV